MKKLLTILSIVALMCMLFAVSVSAEKEITGVTDTFYIVSSQDSEAALQLKSEGKQTVVLSEIYSSTKATAETDWICGFAEGSHIELIFAESIVEEVNDYVGILLNKKITLTVRYNGFCHLITNKGANNAVGPRESVFVLKHSNAAINFIGSSNIYNEDGTFNKNFTYNPNDLTSNNVDVRHGKVYCWIFDGDAYAENIRSTTGEEFVYVDSDNSSADAAKVNSYEFVSCALRSNGMGIGLLGEGSAEKILKIDSCFVSNVEAQTIRTGTYFKDSELGNFTMDCWTIKNNLATFENCIIGNITTKSGRTHLKLVNCTYGKISAGADGGGDSFIMIFKTADCENAGTYELVRSTSKNSTFPWQDMVDEFNAENGAALGHAEKQSISFAGSKFLSNCTSTVACTRCGSTTSQQVIDPLFTCLGFSYFENPSSPSICIGFKINYNGVEQYEALSGAELDFGVVAASQNNLGTGNAPLDENGNPVSLNSGSVIKVSLGEEIDSTLGAFTMKIILTEAHADTALLMSGYIMETKDGANTVYYMQKGNAIVSDNAYDYVSYNSLRVDE